MSSAHRHAELELAMLDEIHDLVYRGEEPTWRRLIGWQNPERDEYTYRRLLARGAIVELGGEDWNPGVAIAGEAVSA
jgi:hypothetical protein